MNQSYYCGKFEDDKTPKTKRPTRPHRLQRRSWVGLRHWSLGGMTPREKIRAKQDALGVWLLRVLRTGDKNV